MMNCPLCGARYERVTVTDRTGTVITIRCPSCNPNVPDFTATWQNLWGRAEVTVTEATDGEAMAEVVKRAFARNDDRGELVAILTEFNTLYLLIGRGPGEPADHAAARRDLVERTIYRLGKFLGEALPL